MPKEKKYTLETLLPLNVSYDRDHGLTQEDVDMVNDYVDLIERTRLETIPQVGDRLIYVDKYGRYYGYALIEAEVGDEGLLSICEQPYIPFVWEKDNQIRLNVSGGAFHRINPADMKFVKWVDGSFKDWGHCGACANGTVAFYAMVPLWSYSEPDPLYGDFTTETWRQFYLRKYTEPDTRYLYSGDGIAFKDEDELQQFITDYEGTMFPGNRENSFVLWCFRREYVFLPQEEWEKVDAPIVERRLNFHPEQVKTAKDMEKHITTFYRIRHEESNINL